MNETIARAVEMADNFLIRLHHKKPAIWKISMWAIIYVVGGTVIVFLALKEFYERRKRR